MSASAGERVASSRRPSSVGATARVVRAISRTPRLASSACTAWLTADGAMARSAAAWRKLPARATAAENGELGELGAVHCSII